MPSRSQLKAAIRQLPIWTEVSEAYTKAAEQADLSGCLRTAWEKGTVSKADIKACAARVRDQYKGAWTA